MRTYEEYKRILQLWEQGHNKVQIVKLLVLPFLVEILILA